MSKEAEAKFFRDFMVQVHNSTCFYMKTGRMILFTHRREKKTGLVFWECFEDLEC
jgi:hypothetical protein